MNSNRSPSELTVTQLKDILKAKGLSAVGVKHDLINRLMMSDPTGAWMEEETSDGAGAIASEDSGVGAAPSTNSPNLPTPPTEAMDSRSVDMRRKEQELAEREIQLLRRELEMMREMQRLNFGGQSASQNATVYSGQHASAMVNESMKAMLNYFDGSGETFDAWERQLALLRVTYRLDDNAAKLLAVSRLKNQALEWFHSKPEHIGMCIDELVKELKDIFGDRQDRITARREFEGRTWKREETFAEYFHCKVILANRIRIDEEERIEYLIDGIPDHSLRNHAKLQKFKSQVSLLEAFRGVTLPPTAGKGARFGVDGREQNWRRSTVLQRREMGMQRSVGAGQHGSGAMWRTPPSPRRWEEFQRQGNAPRWREEGIQRRDDGVQRRVNGVQRRDDGMQQRHNDEVQQREVRDPGRCYNCGGRDHFFYECPLRSRGSKCFECREFGHMAANCPTKGTPATEESLAVRRAPREKYFKKVLICEREVNALIDTGSDLCLMRRGQYNELKPRVPALQDSDIYFRGIGSNTNKAIGEFKTEARIDGDSFPIIIRVIPDGLMTHGFLIGTDFLDATELIVKQGQIVIRRAEQTEIPHISEIDLEYAINEVDISYVEGAQTRGILAKIIDDYKPMAIREAELKMTIVLKDDEPVFQRARRLSPSERDTVNEQVQEWLRDGIVQHSLSEYASPVVLVKKKDGSSRLCVDYRLLNRKIARDRYPLPLIEDQLDLLQGAKIYSTLDLKNGFFHVELSRDSRKYTSFIVPDGQYEFLKVPFGLCNSPSVFQRFINSIFRELIAKKIVLVYIDDIIIPSIDYESGLNSLKVVLRVASEAGLLINWDKCRFLQPQVEYLGHIVKDGTVRPSERKTEAVARFPKPKNFKQVQSFLGLTGYFRKFIPHYSLTARPLSNLLKAEVKFQFGIEQEHAFEQLKIALASKPVLRLYKVRAETELHTDASKFGYGAILLQKDDCDSGLHPVYFASGKTTPAEERYSSYELEVLAIIKSLKKFRVYLLGIPFRIVTDCRAFALTMRKKDLCVRVARWALLLEEFEYTIEHRPGKNLVHVDALSRNPLPSCMLVGESESSINGRLRKAQREDPGIRKIFELVESGRAEGYTIRGGIIFKEIEGDIRLVVPKSMRTQVVKRAHENGHFASEKTEAVLKKDYWFQNMREKVDKVVRNCVDCILAERKRGRPEGFLFSISKGEVPLDTFHIDHLGPLPSTKKRYCYIFAVIDAFSKFVWLYATKSCNSAEVIEHLRKQSGLFGNPRRIISDRGTAFTSAAFEAYCKDERISHVLTTSGIPRANGQVERVNRTLVALLTKLSAPKPGEWHKYLDRCQKCFNTVPNRSTKTTPFKILFGVDAKFKDDPQVVELLECEWEDLFQQNRDELREQARQNILKIQQENRRSFNKKRIEGRKYRVGDLVAIRRTQLGPGLKFAAKYFGPYEVTTVLRNDRYVVTKVGEHEGPRQTSTAVDYIKPWVDGDSDDLCSDTEEICDGPCDI
ncbi:Transposon Tf2-9 polyprotein [Anthophora retusa]